MIMATPATAQARRMTLHRMMNVIGCWVAASSSCRNENQGTSGVVSKIGLGHPGIQFPTSRKGGTFRMREGPLTWRPRVMAQRIFFGEFRILEVLQDTNILMLRFQDESAA